MTSGSWLLSLAVFASGMAGAQVLPARFEHDRVLLEANAPDGSTVRFYTDSGGGFNAIGAEAAKRLGLPYVGDLDGDDGKPLRLLGFTPALAAQVPPPLPEEDRAQAGRLIQSELAAGDDHEGFLGSRWLAGRRWRFDYPARQLSLWAPDWKPGPDWHGTALHFLPREDGARPFHFPRFTVEIDGESLDMLLDTGAQARLGPDAAKLYQLPEGTAVASSFIVASTFERWRRRHPDWRVAASGDMGTGRPAPMIEVPIVGIAGIQVGPVWFAVREDHNFHEFMSSMMDARVEGAVGGSAFRYLRMALDYPGETAWFQKPAATATATATP